MKVEKGLRGYRASRKKRMALMVLFFVLAIILQLLARFFINQIPAKNILTVMAVLTVLPAANLASPLVASWGIHAPEESLFGGMKGAERKGTVLYELIITSRDFIMPVDAAVIHPHAVILYCPSPRINPGKAEAFVNEMLKKQGLASNAKVIKDQKSFFRRLDSLRPASDYDDDGSTVQAALMLKSLSM